MVTLRLSDIDRDRSSRAVSGREARLNRQGPQGKRRWRLAAAVSVRVINSRCAVNHHDRKVNHQDAKTQRFTKRHRGREKSERSDQLSALSSQRSGDQAISEELGMSGEVED